MHPVLAQFASSPPSPERLARLRDALVSAGGPLRRTTDDGAVELTFVWIGEARSLALQCGLIDHGGRAVPMQQLGTESVWFATVEAPDDTLVGYRFVVDDPFARAGTVGDDEWQRLMLEQQLQSFADPHNPARILPLAALFGLEIGDAQYESVLALDHAPAAPWFRPHGALAGSLERFELASTALGDTRDITVYLPPGGAGGEPLPLVVLLDGPSWITIGELPRALDAAIHEGALAPAAVAFVHEAHGSGGLADRVRELSCNPSHAAMLLTELLPALQSRYPVGNTAAATVLGGASLGGLAAAYTAMEGPGAVGNVLSVSGSFWYGAERDGTPEWLSRRLATGAFAGFRLYQQIGRLEDAPLPFSPGVSHLVANRHFRDVAIAKGHEVVYEETTTAHDLVAFRVALVRGLVALLPGPAAALPGPAVALPGRAGSTPIVDSVRPDGAEEAG